MRSPLSTTPGINFTSANFKVTPEELHRQSTAVSSKVNGIRTRFNEMELKINSSASYWNGDAAEAFRDVYAGYKDEILEIVARLSEHIVDLERMAGVYENAEASANELVESLPSDVIV